MECHLYSIVSSVFENLNTSLHYYQNNGKLVYLAPNKNERIFIGYKWKILVCIFEPKTSN